MSYSNTPASLPTGVYHRTFRSVLLDADVGYCIYLPAGYDGGDERYPVEYHLHGWQGSESSDTWAMEPVYSVRRGIMVFPYLPALPTTPAEAFAVLEGMLLTEFIPHIDSTYRTIAARESRSISGFSMGGGMALCYAVRSCDLFSSVTAYAGTYHHYYHPAYSTVGESAERAEEIYRTMTAERRYDNSNNILLLLERAADDIRGRLGINLRVGTEDVLYCDNEILRMHLEALRIPHGYVRIEGAAHELKRIV